MSCDYCDNPANGLNMEGRRWCSRCHWWAVEIRRLRMRVALMTSTRTPWLLRALPRDHPWTKNTIFVQADQPAMFSDSGRLGLGVEVHEAVAPPDSPPA